MKTKLSDSGEWETPDELYNMLCQKYKLKPSLDVAANEDNCKCVGYLPDYATLKPDISWKCNPSVTTIWCNPPHKLNKQFVEKAYYQWEKNNLNIMMILPANSICTNYAEDFILDSAEYYPINRSYCRFLHEGKETAGSRNGYFVVIWRRNEN